MTETTIIEKGGEGRKITVRRDWARRLLNELLALFVALLAILAAALILLDTAPGHRFIVDRIAGIETSSGLKIRIGRIDGSVFGKSQLRNVAVSDQQGVFLTSPEIALDWSPGAWLANRLSIDSLTAERINLVRLPHLKPSGKKGPILPGFDIHVGELRIDRLDIGSAVSGKARSGRVSGKADVRSGRALVELNAYVNDGGDRLNFKLDAEPDRNRFDIDARVRSPATESFRRWSGPSARSRSTSRGQGRGRGGAGMPHSTLPAGRPSGSRSGSMTAAIAWRANGRRRNSSRASSIA